MPGGLKRRAGTGAVLAALLAVWPSVVSAGTGGGGGQGGGGSEDGVITAIVNDATEGSSTRSACSWQLHNATVGVPNLGTITWPFTLNGVTYNLFVRTCPEGVSYFSVPDRDPEDLLPQLLTDLKQRTLPQPTPVFTMLDPEFGWAYAQTPLDFRAGSSWHSVSVTASVGPIWARVTAVPRRLTFDPGDPAGPGPVSCSGNGPVAAYVPTAPGTCSYTYLNASSTSPVDGYHFRTRMTIDWSISWTSSTGAGGALASYSTSTVTPLAVAEVKGLVTCTGPQPEQGGC